MNDLEWWPIRSLWGRYIVNRRDDLFSSVICFKVNRIIWSEGDGLDIFCFPFKNVDQSEYICQIFHWTPNSTSPNFYQMDLRERVHMPDISLDAEFHTDTSGGIHLIIERIEELMLILIGQTKIIFFSLLVKHCTVSSSNIHSFGWSFSSSCFIFCWILVPGWVFRDSYQKIENRSGFYWIESILSSFL